MPKHRDLEYERRNLVKVSIKESGLVRSLAGTLSTLFVFKIFLDFISGFQPTPDGIWLFIQITVVIYF